MYVSIRKYNKVKSPEQVLERVQAEFVGMLEQMPGFRGYYAIDCGDGAVASISVFETREAALASNDKAAAWVKERLADLIEAQPEITAGEAKVYSRG